MHYTCMHAWYLIVVLCVYVGVIVFEVKPTPKYYNQMLFLLNDCVLCILNSYHLPFVAFDEKSKKIRLNSY